MGSFSVFRIVAAGSALSFCECGENGVLHQYSHSTEACAVRSFGVLQLREALLQTSCGIQCTSEHNVSTERICDDVLSEQYVAGYNDNFPAAAGINVQAVRKRQMGSIYNSAEHDHVSELLSQLHGGTVHCDFVRSHAGFLLRKKISGRQSGKVPDSGYLCGSDDSNSVDSGDEAVHRIGQGRVLCRYSEMERIL